MSISGLFYELDCMEVKLVRDKIGVKKSTNKVTLIIIQMIAIIAEAGPDLYCATPAYVFVRSEE